MVVSYVEQFTSPAHHVAVKNFSDTAEGTAQVQERVACGWVQQDAGTAYAGAAI